ncbi:MAG: PD-(D/E)XK nuclease family protein, partial [Actinobacteria bacterium]|nr:PD-(D/E)XK nuclease family protein [Actinomycetota bacterium]
VDPGRLDPEHFEVADKGSEIAVLLGLYEKELRNGKLVDYADIIRMAMKRLREDGPWLQEDVLLIAPADMLERLEGLERLLWEAVPEARRTLLEVDRPGEERKDGLCDSALLSWVRDPTAAPLPKGDGTACMFRAVGEVNEIREVFRTCVEDGVHFDDVELLYTDSDTYVPLIYEIASALSDDPDEPLPVTFMGGIPVRYSRPARALIGWLSWIAEDYLQSTLARMIKDGLLEVPRAEGGPLNFQRLGAMLGALPIGNGRERYIEALDRKIESLSNWSEAEMLNEEDEPPEIDVKRRRLSRRIEAWTAVRTLVGDLLSGVPKREDDQKARLQKAMAFLRTRARAVNEFDSYSRSRMLDAISELADCIEGEIEGLDVMGWLLDLAQSEMVGGQGPRPGSIFAAPLYAGGHSGRGRTFIIGLDDTRFPGTGRQDPLMLDGERRGVSGDLPTGAGRLARTVEDFTALLARLRGTVTLGYCSRSLADDRDMFPAPALLAAYRILSGNREGNQEDFLKWLPGPSSFAPTDPSRCATVTDWWLWRTCSAGPVLDPEMAVSQHFPHLARGLEARRARASNLFTEYDGYVPEAGTECDPSRPGAPAFSASRLEMLGSSPMDYFFKYVLGIELPEEFKIDPTVWLDPLQQGELLHEVFRDFMSRLIEEGRRPDHRRDIDSVQGILSDQVDAWKVKVPPLSRDVFERQVREMGRTVDIFLREEAEHCRESTPLCCEALIGMATAEGCERTPLCSVDLVPLELPSGRVVMTRGKVDRVDRLPSTNVNTFAVWDYKTGRRLDDLENDPFRCGRRVQNILYHLMVTARLSSYQPGARVVSFGYLFPHPRHHGKRVVWQWRPEQLEEGKRVLDLLCRMAASGCFPYTTDPGDVRYSDYKAAVGDVAAAVEASARKLENLMNEALEPYRELRGR